MAVSDAFFRLSEFQATHGSISATVTMLADGLDWTLSCVYGPQGDQEKLLFLNELRGLKYVVKPRWLILGDFNLITKAADKNNQNINNHLIGSFRSVLNHLQLKEMWLSVQKFTWSSAQENPVLTKIDHFFHSDGWDELFPMHTFKPSPLLARTMPCFSSKGILRCVGARLSSLKSPGFVYQTAKALKKWQRDTVGVLRTQIDIAKEKVKLRQRACLTGIRLGDINSKFFHAKVNGRRQENYIQTLHSNHGVAIMAEDKEQVLLSHLQEHLGIPTLWNSSLIWDNLEITSHDLSELDTPFDEDEIKDLANLRGDGASLINSANIIVLPKKADARVVGDYRPISLIHSLSKIFSKLLANRLALILPTLVSKCQCTFVQKRSIHDNFLHVQNLIKDLHHRNIPGLFLKLHISKAFDSVN
ncbi:uncharacterized protein [Aegilops tauschii subsp. strangulata]|uniref:uncharacterized protein n=1 Tax=Aegilops tauschii subsp. strangulata TaxID=200361 RepID=UPI003CC8BF1E